MTTAKLLMPSGHPVKLLTAAASNPKTAKGSYLPYTGALLHLSPADRSGYQVCTHASDACKYACLNTAGRGGVGLVDDSNATQRARIRKTRFLFEQTDAFMAQLVS